MNTLKPVYLVTNNTYTIETLDIIFEINGYIGSITLALCLVPQLIKIIKTKSVDDISYIWQFLYLIGLGFVISYSVYFNLPPIFIPVGLEFFMVSLLTFLKYYYTYSKNNKLKNELELNNNKKLRESIINNLRINTNV